MVSIDNLSVEFGSFTLLNNISFVVNKRERIALVGKNGAGKSTLLKIIAGAQQPSKGRVSSPKDTTIGYLPQQMILNDDNTVMAEASLAFEYIQKMEEELNYVNEQLTIRTDYESDAYSELIERTTTLSEKFHMFGGNNFEAEVEKTLLGLGFTRKDLSRPTSEFSGGWRMRIELAKILLQQPDVLLLDEPTNHLDIESIQWLEHFLATKANAVILVSHDRAFLDAVTQRTIEISLGQTHDYRVSYSKYVELRKEHRDQQMRAYENQQREIQKTEEFIDRFRYQASKAVQVQSRIKQLDKIERIELDEVDTSRLNLRFQPAPRSGSYPVIAEDLEKRFGDKLVFSKVNFTIERGEKIAFVGKNGEGKSTLVKCIMQQLEYTGKLKLGHNVKIGYFAQNQAQLLDGEQSIFETIDNVAVGEIRTQIRRILGAFMFGGEASEKKVKVLSGGERSRLAMIKLLLEPVNLLILDEPTNHLDMDSKDVLKQALVDFDGTIILVSHDRYFLDGLVDKVYEFGNQKVVEHLGGIYDFLRNKDIESLAELEKANKKKDTPTVKPKTTTVQAVKLSYDERKELNKDISKVERQIKNLEEEIAKTENKVEEVEQILANPDKATDSELFEQHGKLNKRIEEAMHEWDDCNKELEMLSKKLSDDDQI